MDQSSHAVPVDPAMLASARNRTRRKKSPRKATAKPAPVTANASAAALDRLRNRLHRITPSATWRDDLYGLVVNGVVPHKDRIERELDRRDVFPPGGSAGTLMRTCPKCGGTRWFPPQYLVSDRRILGKEKEAPKEICTDCVENGRAPRDRTERDGVELADGGTTVSPTTLALEELKARGGAIEETPLETENVAVLKAQIARYLAGKPTTLLAPHDPL